MQKILVVLLIVPLLSGCSAETSASGSCQQAEEYRKELQKYQIIFGTPKDWTAPPELTEQQIEVLRAYLKNLIEQEEETTIRK